MSDPLTRVEAYINARRHTNGQGNMIHGLFDETGDPIDLFCSDLAVLVAEVRRWRADLAAEIAGRDATTHI